MQRRSWGGQGSINEVSSVPSAEEVVDEAVFMFNSPLVITVMDKTLTACCCGAESTLVCSRCRTAAYCSQVCQVGEWARHKEECGGCEGAVELLGDKEKKGEVVKKRKLVRKQSAGQQDISDGTGSPRSTEDTLCYLGSYEGAPKNGSVGGPFLAPFNH